MPPQVSEMTEPLLSAPILSSEENEFSKSQRYQKFKDKILYRVEVWERRSPALKKVTNQIRRIPPWLRVAFIIWWIIWKFIWLFLAIRLLWWSTSTNITPSLSDSSAMVEATTNFGHDSPDSKVVTKVLYIVTSLAEYDNGERKTIKGRDRFQELMVPCIIDSIKSMISHPYDLEVDLYLITAYKIREERQQYLQDLLPIGVGLEIWDDACPLGYDKRDHPNKVDDVTRALARQHRYVIKDKLHHYDVFVPFEDDMRVTGAHIQHFLDMSVELERLTHEAPEAMSDVPESEDPKKMKFFGQMTRRQMKRLIPGLIRVEVLVDELHYGAQKELAPIELDYEVNGVEQHIDPTVCCHVPNMQPIFDIPVRPSANDVIIWETRAEALSVRHIHGSKLFDWTILLPGPGKREDPAEKVMGFWSGRDGAFGNMEKPSGGVPDLIAQQGGWMATREQIIRLDEELCMGNFLPPFDPDIYYDDGQQSMNVEFW
jgi:hypothetical protein